MALRAPGAPEPRVTLTAPVLKGALFNQASVRYVDFSAGKLNGASFIGADLEGAERVRTEHVSEALQYRSAGAEWDAGG